MAKPKSETQEQKPEPVEQTPEQLQSRIAELEAKLAEGDEAALKRVAKAAGVDVDVVLDHEKKAITPKEDVIAIDMASHEVKINGKTYRGKVEVPASVAEVINQAIGQRRMRHMRELTGNDYTVEMLTGGGYSSRVVGQVNEHGERIA